MKTYIQKGENINIASPYDVTSGHGVKSGLIFGVASGDARSGADVDVVMVGVFELPKVSTDVFAVGAAVYWDNTAKLMTSTTTSGAVKVGVTTEAKCNPSGSVKVRLNGTF